LYVFFKIGKFETETEEWLAGKRYYIDDNIEQ